MELICAHCGKTFTPRGRRGPKPTYCSAVCRIAERAKFGKARRKALRAARLPKPVRRCERCGKTLKRDQTRFCSVLCANRTKGEARARRYTCRHCGKAFVPKKSDRRTFCSRECAFAYRRTRAEEAKVKPLRTCAICGKRFIGQANAKYCSKACRYERYEHGGRKAITYICQQCGQPFSPPYRDKRRTYCSRCCTVEAARRAQYRYRAPSNHEPAQEPYTLEEIYLRDGGRCQLCGKRLNLKNKVPHPHAPTIDHLVPLSWGGDDVKANVQLACFICNSIKSNQQPVQLRMVEWGI